MAVVALSRANALVVIRQKIAKEFPGATVTTNDDANPATPMAVTATWRRGTIVKAVRAGSIRATLEEFEQQAMRVLSKFQETNVPARYQTKQPE